MSDSEPHECDLFLLTSNVPYVADRILPAFARKGCRNIHGWGIGSFAGSDARVVRRAEPATGDDSLSKEFATAVEVISSPIMLGHLRLTSRGKSHVQNNHPFCLNFLDYDWLLIHNGTARRHEKLVPIGDRILVESDNDTPRVFEFLRREIIEYYESRPQHSLIEACRSAFSKLLQADPDGKFNLILSNGFLSFVFIHWRTFYLLHRPKQTGHVALISTIENLTENEEWIPFDRQRSKQAKLLVFSGATLILNGDIPA